MRDDDPARAKAPSAPALATTAFVRRDEGLPEKWAGDSDRAADDESRDFAHNRSMRKGDEMSLIPIYSVRSDRNEDKV